MQIDQSSIATLASVIGSVLLPIASAIYTWIATRDKDNSQHIKAVEEVLNERVARLTSRQDRIEEIIKHLPSAADASVMKTDIREIQTRQEAQLRETAAIRGAVDRIEDFLLRGSPR